MNIVRLAENIINTFKFTYFDDPFVDVKNEVVAFMVMNIHKYDHTKGSKAFSYFSVVAKNYLILHNNNNYKKYKTHHDISALSNMSIKNNESNLFLNENNDDASVSSTITLSDESLFSILTSFLEPASTISASCSKDRKSTRLNSSHW